MILYECLTAVYDLLFGCAFQFQECEKRRYEAEKKRADQKHRRQLEELQAATEAHAKELEQMQNEKR